MFLFLALICSLLVVSQASFNVSQNYFKMASDLLERTKLATPAPTKLKSNPTKLTSAPSMTPEAMIMAHFFVNNHCDREPIAGAGGFPIGICQTTAGGHSFDYQFIPENGQWDENGHFHGLAFVQHREWDSPDCQGPLVHQEPHPIPAGQCNQGVLFEYMPWDQVMNPNFDLITHAYYASGNSCLDDSEKRSYGSMLALEWQRLGDCLKVEAGQEKLFVSAQCAARGDPAINPYTTLELVAFDTHQCHQQPIGFANEPLQTCSYQRPDPENLFLARQEYVYSNDLCHYVSQQPPPPPPPPATPEATQPPPPPASPSSEPAPLPQ